SNMQCPLVLFPLDINRRTTCLLSSKASDYADSLEGEDQGPYWIKVQPGIRLGIIRLSALPSRSKTTVNQAARGSSANRCSISAVFGAVFSNHGITSLPSVAIRPGSTSLLTYRNGWPSMAFTQ